MRLSTYLSVGALALASFSTAHAQTTGLQFGAKAGMSLAVLDGQINRQSSFKPGLATGVFLRWRPSARVAIQPELVLSQQGVTNSRMYGTHTGYDKIKLNYLNLPVLLKIYLGNVVNLQAGPQLGLLLSGRHTGQVGYIESSYGNTGFVEVDEDVSKNYRSDVSLYGGLGADLKNGLTFSMRMNYGMTDINNDDAEKAFRQSLNLGGVHNRAFEFAVGYAFKSK